MIIRITKHDGTFITNVPTTPANLSEKIEYCKSKYPLQEYHADLITYLKLKELIEQLKEK